MKAGNRKPRVAIVSPFLDKRHGSERIILEWLSHLSEKYEIHVYSQRVEDADLSSLAWHRIPTLPGPHLFNFLWWLVAIRLWIWWDRRSRDLYHDLIFSSGTNFLGADIVCVHIVFAQYLRDAHSGLRFLRNSALHWPRLVHRKLYYAVANWMERRAYSDPRTTLIAFSKKTVREIREFYDRCDRIPVIYLGLDHGAFNPGVRASLRNEARFKLELLKNEFALILVGNDWRNKGVLTLLEALEKLRGLPIKLLIVSREDPAESSRFVKKKYLESQVRFLAPRKDIEFYYAAADAYAGPSLQDSFGLPPAEAMACGLPVIVSGSAGVSEIVTDELNGLVLKDPRDSVALAVIIRRLYEDEMLCRHLGQMAAQTLQQFTWERSGIQVAEVFDQILGRKSERHG